MKLDEPDMFQPQLYATMQQIESPGSKRIKLFDKPAPEQFHSTQEMANAMGSNASTAERPIYLSKPGSEAAMVSQEDSERRLSAQAEDAGSKEYLQPSKVRIKVRQSSNSSMELSPQAKAMPTDPTLKSSEKTRNKSQSPFKLI